MKRKTVVLIVILLSILISVGVISVDIITKQKENIENDGIAVQTYQDVLVQEKERTEGTVSIIASLVLRDKNTSGIAMVYKITNASDITNEISEIAQISVLQGDTSLEEVSEIEETLSKQITVDGVVINTKGTAIDAGATNYVLCYYALADIQHDINVIINETQGITRQVCLEIATIPMQEITSQETQTTENETVQVQAMKELQTNYMVNRNYSVERVVAKQQTDEITNLIITDTVTDVEQNAVVCVYINGIEYVAQNIWELESVKKEELIQYATEQNAVIDIEQVDVTKECNYIELYEIQETEIDDIYITVYADAAKTKVQQLKHYKKVEETANTDEIRYEEVTYNTVPSSKIETAVNNINIIGYVVYNEEIYLCITMDIKEETDLEIKIYQQGQMCEKANEAMQEQIETQLSTDIKEMPLKAFYKIQDVNNLKAATYYIEVHDADKVVLQYIY
jgi:hypothetical protein